MNKIKIGKHLVGDGCPCFIIAEAGSNHNRDFKRALKLIDIASDAGADAVKFQTYSAEKLYSRKTPMAPYLKTNKLVKNKESLYDLAKKIEIPRQWHKDMTAYCKKKDIVFMSTPFDLGAVDELEKVGILSYKIASYEITHLPLLEYAARTGKPIILSTGMADLSDIKTALDVIYKTGNHNVILLHCAIDYPVKYEDLNLRAMKTMKDKFRLPIGFSDHTLGVTSDIAAVALGACVIEKHFTLDRNLPGPDHPFSLEPNELKAMVQAIRDTELSLGSSVKKRTPIEERIYKNYRRGLVAACDIPKGAKITGKMIAVKRPGYGIQTKMMGALIGRIAKRNIEEDDILIWSMFKS